MTNEENIDDGLINSEDSVIYTKVLSSTFRPSSVPESTIKKGDYN